MAELQRFGWRLSRVFGGQRFGRRAVRRGRPVLVVQLFALVLALGLGAGLVALLPDRDAAAPMPERVAAPAPELPVRAHSFAACGGRGDDSCVVDGDTFRLDGVRIRIADIDTPEAQGFACPEEKRLADLATRRLTELLNAGPFVLAPADRDEDRYGRKLRIVMRDGVSLGEVMVDEGLARRWDGARRGWC